MIKIMTHRDKKILKHLRRFLKINIPGETPSRKRPVPVRATIPIQHLAGKRRFIMGRNFGKWMGMMVMAAMLCLIGLHGVDDGHAAGSNPRFKDNGNNTVTDTHTDRMWMKNAKYFGFHSWYGADASCNSFSISGIGNWRLPSRSELEVLFNAISGGHPFINIVSGGRYWSSTTHSGNPNSAATVGNGTHYLDKNAGWLVWCVR